MNDQQQNPPLRLPEREINPPTKDEVRGQKKRRSGHRVDKDYENKYGGDRNKDQWN